MDTVKELATAGASDRMFTGGVQALLSVMLLFALVALVLAIATLVVVLAGREEPRAVPVAKVLARKGDQGAIRARSLVRIVFRRLRR